MYLITFQVKDPYDDKIKKFRARVLHGRVLGTHYVFCKPEPNQGVECIGKFFVKSDVEEDATEISKKQRNIQFFDLESQRKVTGSYVVVIGLEGVGSHAASMLLRSGFGKVLLVDFDQVSLSSLNRHAVATRADVGIPKAICLKKHLSSIFPECHVEAKVMLYDSSSEEEILSGNPDFVLDCIDNIGTKVGLLAACVKRGLKVLCATDAGARADPTRIRVADLRESTIDPLSRSVRHRLRREHGIEGGISCLPYLDVPTTLHYILKHTNKLNQSPPHETLET